MSPSREPGIISNVENDGGSGDSAAQREKETYVRGDNCLQIHGFIEWGLYFINIVLLIGEILGKRIKSNEKIPSAELTRRTFRLVMVHL